MAGKGGGAWKVAYADFVTAMMAFFMVMWLTAQKPQVKEAVAGYFRDPFATYKGVETGHAAEAKPVKDPAPGHDAVSQDRPLPRSGDDTNYQFSVLFGVDSVELDAAAKEHIRRFVPTMIGKLNRIEVRAHCVAKPLPKGGAYSDRWALCYARARSVQAELEALKIERERIRISQAESNEPIAANLAEDELRLNSRVDVILLPELADVPWRQRGEGDIQKVTTPPAAH